MTARITDTLTDLDALLAGHENDWWDAFYGNRAKPCPFFVSSLATIDSIRFRVSELSRMSPPLLISVSPRKANV